MELYHQTLKLEGHVICVRPLREERHQRVSMNREMASSTEELKDFEPVSTTYHDSGCRKDWPLVSPVTSFILRYQNVGEPLEVARQFGLVFTINEVVRTAYKQAEANVP